MKKIVLYIVLLMITVSAGGASIKGLVTDESKQPIGYANVMLLRSADSVFINGVVTKEDGSFSDDADKGQYLVKVSCIGYETKTVACDLVNDTVLNVVLTSIDKTIKEIVVKGNRPIFKQKDGVLVTDVQNSLLSREHSVQDVLQHIPGVVKTPDGNLKIFGGGSPVIYINNRKVQTKTDLQQLDVKNIKRIELIANPGAEYDATNEAVLKIITINKDLGWTAAVDATAQWGERFTNNEDIHVGYVTDKLSLSGYYAFKDYKNKSFNPSTKTVTASKGDYTYDTDAHGLTDERSHEYQFSLEYNISDNYAIGAKYNGSRLPSDYSSMDNLNTYLDREPVDNIAITSKQDNKTNTDHINAFFNATYSKKLSSEMNLDYVSNTSDNQQNTVENGLSKQLNSLINSSSDYKLYSGNMTFNYKINDNNSLVMGVEGSYINGSDRLVTNSESVDESHNESEETKYAAFTQYNCTLNKFNLKLGLRYENVKSKFRDVISAENNISKTYNNVFPFVSLSYNNNGFNNTLSFSSRITRPDFRALSNSVYYANQFMYQKGNPQLVPERRYILQWSSSYKYISLRLRYDYTKDYIFPYLKSMEGDDSHILSTYKNYDNIKYLKANVSAQKTFGWYNPSLSVGVSKPYFSVEYLGEDVKYNDVNVYFTLNQYFTLPHDILLSVNYYFDNGGSNGPVKFKTYQMLNLSLKKSFLNKTLDVSIDANDIFHTMKYKEDERIGNIILCQTEDFRPWNYSVSVRYTFNQKKSRYHGKSSSSDINRLGF